VENSAQWKMLKLKEKQKLEANPALDFNETPEPATWLLLAGFLIFLAGNRIYRKRQEQ